ncbi:MAG: hypothetical protein DRO15_00500 [Thermoprotei archaeon]|nr:MAG: hypothetical protein DRO15_00500 [Thermoprotei archaeon]
MVNGYLYMLIAISIISISSFILSLILLTRLIHIKKALSLLSPRSFRKAIKAYEKRLVKRYIVFEIFDSGINIEELRSALIDSLSRELGILNLASCNIKLIWFSAKKRCGILRVKGPYACIPSVLSALSLVRDLNNRKVIIVPIKVSGTLKRARKYIGTR